MFVRTRTAKWSLPAFVLGALVLTTASATAGNPGDPFLLGEPNSVNQTTSLTGATSGFQLKISNTSGGGIEGDAAKGYGIYGTSPDYAVTGFSASGTGIFGEHTSSTGNTPGIFGQTNSTSAQAFGVFGIVWPTLPGSSSAAVRGKNNGTGQSGIGVWGSQAGSGFGVYGTAPTGRGVYGLSTGGNGVVGGSISGGGALGTSATGTGVYGQHTATTGTAPGVFAKTNSTAAGASALKATVAPTAPDFGSAGVRGINNGTGEAGIGVWGSQAGSGVGVYGSASSGGVGVEGTSNNAATPGTGVYGQGDPGVQGAGKVGVEGDGGDGDSQGIYGHSDFGAAGYFLTYQGYAGYFAGPVTITGGCTGCAGPSVLQIDDPLDPAHKYLQHSSVVSSQQLDVYSGNVTTNAKGFATVTMPSWFQALNRSFRYQLTSLSGLQQVAVAREMRDNSFTIQSQRPHSKVSWEVTAVRHDRYANANPTRAIVLKPKADQDKYVHPELYGKPRSDGIGYEKPPRLPHKPVLKP